MFPSPMEKNSEDVVLRSSDGSQFRVHKSVLSSASPVFSGMLSVPQPDSDSDTPIDVSEDGKILRLILNICETHSLYSSPHINLSDIAHLLQAADKYDITIVHKQAVHSLSRPKFLEKEPLRVYCIASRYGAYDTAALAAQHFLQYSPLQVEYFPELEIVDGGTIYRILQYHQQCKEAVLDVAVDHTWIRVGTYEFMGCPGAEEVDSDDDDDEVCTTTIRTLPSRKHKRGHPKSVFVHPWWLNFMAATKDALSESMDPETIRDKGRVKGALSLATKCSHCRKIVKSDFGKFLDAFVNEVEERLKNIKLVQPGAPPKGNLNWG